MSFESDVKRIEEIAQKLNQMETTLEESLSLFEEGMRLSKALEKTLSEAKRKVEVILSEDLTEAETTVLE